MWTTQLLLLVIFMMQIIKLDTTRSETRGEKTGDNRDIYIYLLKETETEMELVESKNILHHSQSFIELYIYFKYQLSLKN